MKTTKKSFTLFLALAGLALMNTGCKKHTDMAPEPDKEFQSSIDASYALQVITDIDMVCSYAGENDLSDHTRFFWEAPGAAPQNIVTQSRDTLSSLRSVFVSFNQAICRDGHMRNGTIRLLYPSDNPNANYYRDPQYTAKISLINYQIDGWNVSLRNDFAVKNLVAVNYNPKVTNLSWSLNGDFDFKHPSDPSKNMHCNVNLVKTLQNTSSITVFPTKLAAINWQLGVAAYAGSMFGETSGNVPFKFNIRDSKPMVRDFQCAPENVKSVKGTEQPRSVFQQSYPFIDGVADFTTSNLYPRVIYYGSENGSAPSCDNSGVIMIKGISYPIDFEKVYQ